MTGVRTEARDQVHARLMAAADEILANSENISASVAEIATRAGISTKTFYLHFADKDAFFYEYWTGRLDRVANRVAERVARETDPIQRVVAFIKGLFDHPDAPTASRGTVAYHLYLASTNPGKIAFAHRKLYELLVELIADAQSGHALSNHADAHELAGPILELVVATVKASRIGSSVTPRPCTPDQVLRFCLAGLGTQQLENHVF